MRPSRLRSTGLTVVGIHLLVISATILGSHYFGLGPVSANRLQADGSLHVPSNPSAVSWASQDVAPGSRHGTIILVGQINYGGVAGAFSDLAGYRVGQLIPQPTRRPNSIGLVLSSKHRPPFARQVEPLGRLCDR